MHKPVRPHGARGGRTALPAPPRGLLLLEPSPARPQVLERAGVEVVQRTSGRFKRSLQQFEPNTPEGLQKYQEEIDAIHAAFKATRTRNRSGFMDVSGTCPSSSPAGARLYQPPLARHRGASRRERPSLAGTRPRHVHDTSTTRPRHVHDTSTTRPRHAPPAGGGDGRVVARSARPRPRARRRTLHRGRVPAHPLRRRRGAARARKAAQAHRPRGPSLPRRRGRSLRRSGARRAGGRRPRAREPALLPPPPQRLARRARARLGRGERRLADRGTAELNRQRGPRPVIAVCPGGVRPRAPRLTRRFSQQSAHSQQRQHTAAAAPAAPRSSLARLGIQDQERV